MYCVKCGVRLQDSMKTCPLCGTPLWHPEETADDRGTYSDRLPGRRPSSTIPAAVFLTFLFVSVSLVCFIFCRHTYGEVRWSGFVMLGLAAAYMCFVFPLWFRRPNPVIFVPVGFAAVEGLLLYVCGATGGHWFLSFAFPVVTLAALVSTAAVVFFRYMGRRKLFIIGSLLIAIGSCTMLVEFFQHITFGTRMFAWSLYSVSVFSAGGLFLILCGTVRPLRDWLIRRAFL